DPFIGAHGLQIFWGANRAAPTGEEIRWASRASTSAPFDNVVVLDELVRPSFDPSLSIDLHHIVFASSVAGTSDIYEAFR
ncbi:MAG TPA: hypothetical protein VGL13_00030, partial [Polyangiaceae bacterium]